MAEVEPPYHARTGKSVPPSLTGKLISCTVPTNRHRSGTGTLPLAGLSLSLHRHWPQAERSGRPAAPSTAVASAVARRRRRCGDARLASSPTPPVSAPEQPLRSVGAPSAAAALLGDLVRLIDLASRFCSGVCADGWLFKKTRMWGGRRR